MPQADALPLEKWDAGRPWRRLDELTADNRLVEFLVDCPQARTRATASWYVRQESPAAGEIIKGSRSSTRWAGCVTYWARFDGRLQMIRPRCWREIEPRPAAARQPAKDHAA